MIFESISLPTTGNLWKRATIIISNQSNQKVTFQSLLRLWSEGSVWFDNFSIRSLLLKTSVKPGETIIDVRNPNKQITPL